MPSSSQNVLQSSLPTTCCSFSWPHKGPLFGNLKTAPVCNATPQKGHFLDTLRPLQCVMPQVCCGPCACSSPALFLFQALASPAQLLQRGICCTKCPEMKSPAAGLSYAGGLSVKDAYLSVHVPLHNIQPLHQAPCNRCISMVIPCMHQIYINLSLILRKSVRRPWMENGLLSHAV
jgi:hypothetical protein